MPPTVLAFILCDGVHRDPHGKLYLLGIFNGFKADKFPTTLRESWLYACFSGGRGEVNVTYRLVDAAELDGKPVITAELPVRFRDPFDVPEALLSFESITFPRPGVYVWQVECAGEVIYQRRIVAEQVG
jgi:hypothetical protein